MIVPDWQYPAEAANVIRRFIGDRLDEVTEWAQIYRVMKCEPACTRGDVKRQVRRLEAALSEALAALDLHEDAEDALQIYMKESLPALTSRLDHDLRRLRHLTWAFEQHWQARGRPDSNRNRRFFLARLADIWERTTGTRPQTVTYDSYSESYRGEFLAFAEACFAPIDGETSGLPMLIRDL